MSTISFKDFMNDVVGLESLNDLERCKNNILPRLYGCNVNEEMLEERPHTKSGDFTVFYLVDLGDLKGGRLSHPIINQMLDDWNISVEELHEIAVSNLKKLNDGSFKTMIEVMRDIMYKEILEDMNYDEEVANSLFEQMFDPVDGEIMYVLSNKRGMHGATLLLNEDFMEEISEKMGESFLILPSSIHELIIVPDDISIDIEYMESMVYEINRAQVSEDERLSDHVYRYTRNKGLERAA